MCPCSPLCYFWDVTSYNDFLFSPLSNTSMCFSVIHGYSKPLCADVIWHHFPKSEGCLSLFTPPSPLPLYHAPHQSWDSCTQLNARFHIYIKKVFFGGKSGKTHRRCEQWKVMLHLLLYNNLMAVKDTHTHTHIYKLGLTHLNIIRIAQKGLCVSVFVCVWETESWNEQQ